MNDLELIIFDMDGLMFDTERIAFACWKEAAYKNGYEIDEKIFAEVIGVNLAREKEIYLTHFGLQFPFEKIESERFNLAEKFLAANGVPIKRGLYELLDYLDTLDIKKAVATSTSKDRAVSLLKKAGIDRRFDYVLCGDEVEKSKPHPDIFLKVAAKLGCAPKRCLVLEDSEAGVIAAYRAGMPSIMIPDRKEPGENVKVLALKQMLSLLDVKLYLEEVFG
ncbi:MAG: HAD family phosphatase [Negativicutes bacterium]|nr:HAD family phosphatase [Negativicutes bacterium]